MLGSAQADAHRSITIVGMGQRGLCLLERLSAILAQDPVPSALTVHLVDPGIPGQGLHKASQPDHLLINSIAGHVTLYYDASVAAGGPVVPGPSFLEWAQARGYRRVDGRVVVSDFGDPIDEHSYLPRSLLGEYMTSVFDGILRTLPASVAVRNHRRQATELVRAEGDAFEVVLAGGYRFQTDYLFLTTGHDGCGPDMLDRVYEGWVERAHPRNSHLAYFRTPYPIESLNTIGSDATVAICGAGLTAADIISALTVGMGGRFERLPGRRLRYQVCGREPKILLYSRQGLPAAGRPVNQKGIYGSYQPRFFTRTFIEGCQRHAGGLQLDWDRDLLPTLKKEMAYVYCCTEKGEWEEPATYEVDPQHARAIENLIAPLEGHSFADQAAYAAFLRRYLEDDVRECFLGNETSPEKAAADMLRDVRDNVRTAVDYGGLTPQSHARFLSCWCSISNRIDCGPPNQRNIELLALMDAGVVSFFGPSPTVSFDDEQARFSLTSTHLPEPIVATVDVLVRAKAEVFAPEHCESPLIRSLLASGIATPFRNGDFKPGGIAIDVRNNVIDRDGRAQTNLWALGYVAEGPHFYTYVLPRPHANSRSLRDAARMIFQLVEAIHEASPDRARAPDPASPAGHDERFAREIA